jgi:hypothetical protein
MSEFDKCPRCESPVTPTNFYCPNCGVEIGQARREVVNSILDTMQRLAHEDLEQQQAFQREQNRRQWNGQLIRIAIILPLFVGVSTGLWLLGTVPFIVGGGVIASYAAMKSIREFGVPGRSLVNNLVVYFAIGIVYFLMYLSVQLLLPGKPPGR